jgi:hypothetical protein
MKNTSAIDKIISELAMKDYLAYNPRLPNGKPKYKRYHPYTLSAKTNEAREVRRQYVYDEITEEEYKAWCLRWNLSQTHVN